MSVYRTDCIRCGASMHTSASTRCLDDMCALCVITLGQIDAVYMKQRRMSAADVAKKYDELGWRLGKARREGWYEEDPGWADIDRILVELGHMKETDR